MSKVESKIEQTADLAEEVRADYVHAFEHEQSARREVDADAILQSEVRIKYMDGEYTYGDSAEAALRTRGILDHHVSAVRETAGALMLASLDYKVNAEAYIEQARAEDEEQVAQE